MTDMHASKAGVSGVASDLRTTLTDALGYVDLLPNPFNPLEGATTRAAHISSLQIRAIIKERRGRDAIFPPNLFGDPAWDMLLELYATSLEQQRIMTTNLCQSSAVPPTTALRWIGMLEEQGLIRKHGDPLDARRVFVALSERGKTMMETFFKGEPLSSTPLVL